VKVLILTVTAGGGHNSPAQALKACLEEKGAQVDILDAFYYISRILGATVNHGYLLLVDKTPPAYAAGFRMLEKRRKNADKPSATRLNALLWTKKVRRYIRNYAPDVIVCTHPVPAIMVDVMKQRNKLSAVTIGINTDFCVLPYWEEGLHMDYLVVAAEGLVPLAMKKGYREEQILPLGIPIHPKFARKNDKRAIREELGLDPDRFTMLIMSGSMGYGNIENLVRQLDDMKYPFQMITVCGNNQEAKAAIDAMTTRKTVVNLGFTRDIDRLMDAADCVVGKPGGLSSSEALAKGLPMILVNPIPGQEVRNVDFLQNSGAAMAVNDIQTLDAVVYDLMTTPEKLNLMRESARLLGKPNSTENICQFILQSKKEETIDE